MIRPLSMQIKILPDNESAKQRALFFPMHLGRSKRLVCTIDDLVNLYHQTHTIPLMDRLYWDPVKSPHCIIEGPSGSGKSYAMTTLYLVCSKIGDTVVVDPKISNLARLTKTVPASKVIVPDFNASHQQDEVSANFETIGLKPIFLFIDEAAALLTGANRQIK